MPSELLPAVNGFLLTYLVHSTLLLCGAWLVAHFWRRSREVRVVVWKAALVGGVVTSLLATAGAFPHFGHRFTLAATDPAISESARTASSVGVASRVPLEGAESTDDERRIVENEREPTDVLAVTAAPDLPARVLRFLGTWLPVVWVAGALFGLAVIAGDWIRLRRLVRGSRPLGEHWLARLADALAANLGIRVEVRVAPVGAIGGPLAAGLLRNRVFVPADLESQLDREQLEAVVAHEVAHLARRDPLWTFVASLAAGVFFLQPLNLLARRRIRIDSEFLADRLAVGLLASPLGLARCLATLAEARMATPRLALGHTSAGVAAVGFQSTLGQRVNAILEDEEPLPTNRRTWTTASVLALLAVLALGPRAEATFSSPNTTTGDESMATLTALTMVAALTGAPEGEDSAESVKVVAVPETVHGFRGQIVGRVVEKDHEQGEFVIHVQKVQRVWRNNAAKEPADLEKKTVRLTGLFGKWLDVLLVVKPGDTVQIEAKHVAGENLQFLGEQFKKVEAVDETKEREEAGNGFPEGLRGFRGILLGKVVSKDVEKGVLVFEATGVKRLWKQNKAKRPESAKGKTLTVNGIAGKWLDVLLSFEKGDAIEVEAFHNRGESLDFVQEWLKKAEAEKE